MKTGSVEGLALKNEGSRTFAALKNPSQGPDHRSDGFSSGRLDRDDSRPASWSDHVAHRWLCLHSGLRVNPVKAFQRRRLCGSADWTTSGGRGRRGVVVVVGC